MGDFGDLGAFGRAVYIITLPPSFAAVSKRSPMTLGSSAGTLSGDIGGPGTLAAAVALALAGAEALGAALSTDCGAAGALAVGASAVGPAASSAGPQAESSDAAPVEPSRPPSSESASRREMRPRW